VSGPAVSVVMPVHNSEAFLDAAVASIRAQTFADFEFIIIDDGSDDRSADILSRHAAEDRRIRVQPQPRRGVIAALNHALSIATGAYVARIDADDIASPNRLERQVTALSAGAEVAVVGSNYAIIDEAGTIRGESNLPTDAASIRNALDRTNCIAHPTVLMRRDVVLAAGGYRPAFVQCEDYDLWLRLSERHDLVNLPEPLLHYRRHPGQLEWRHVEQRALSILGARICARRRRSGQPDPGDHCALVTRGFLREIGNERAIGEEIVRWALDSAAIALRAGYGPAARAALAVVEKEDHVRFRTRLRCWLMRASSYA